MALSDLAAVVDMAPAKVHRYLASFIDGDMVQHTRSGTYDLGPAAADLGLAALSRLDPVNVTADALPDLVAKTGQSALLAVWGNQGPTVVRWEKSALPLITTLGLGSVLPVTNSATGQVFAAFLPERITAARIQAEAPQFDLAPLLAKIREERIAKVDQSFIPGLWALAAPIFDASGAIVAVVSLVASSPHALDPGSPARAALQSFAPASARPLD